MKIIDLTRGAVALVDDDDHLELTKHRWYLMKTLTGRYAVRRERINGKPTSILMHRQLMSTPDGLCVDHRNGNGLDNRRDNLRNCTQLENSRNTKDRTHTSRFKGVSWHKSEGRWRAAIKFDGKQHHLGLYDDEVRAALVYDQTAREHFGEFARTNFPIGDNVATSRLVKKSLYRGVTRQSTTGAVPRWRAFIAVNKRVKNLGAFADEVDAAHAYDTAAMSIHGDAAKLNFPLRLRPSVDSSASVG